MNLPIFAERLSDLMFDKNIKSTELAKNLNCERSTINRYLNAHKTPTVEMLIKLANYFECSTDFLLGIEPENYAENYLSPIPFSQRLPSLLNRLKNHKVSITASYRYCRIHFVLLGKRIYHPNN